MRSSAILSLALASVWCIACLAGNGWCAEESNAFAPTTHIARSVEEIPFSGGMLEIPTLGGTNNRGILKGQIARGQTHVDVVLQWRFLEPEQGRWNHAELDEMLALIGEQKLKTIVLPNTMFAPEWFKHTPNYTPLAEMRSGKTVDMLSPWARGTLAAYDVFYAALAQRYGSQVDILKLAYPGSDFGEVGGDTRRQVPAAFPGPGRRCRCSPGCSGCLR